LFIAVIYIYPVIDPNEHINTIVEKSFITAMDTEIGGRYGRWFNPPVKPVYSILLLQK